MQNPGEARRGKAQVCLRGPCGFQGAGKARGL